MTKQHLEWWEASSQIGFTDVNNGECCSDSEMWELRKRGVN